MRIIFYFLLAFNSIAFGLPKYALSPESISPLIKQTHDKSFKVREEAAFQLGQLGWQTQFSDGREIEIENALLPLLKDPKPEVQLRAVQALGKVGLEKTPELIEPALNSPNRKLQNEALLALFRFQLVLRLRNPESKIPPLDEKHFAKIIEFAKVPELQRNVAYYFVRNEDVRGEELVRPLLKSSDSWTRLYASLALGKMKAKNSNEALREALHDSTYNVRLAAVNALVLNGQSIDPELTKDPAYQVRAAAVAAMDSKNPILETVLKTDVSPAVRAEAVKNLAKMKDKNWLKEMLKEPSWVVREACMSVAKGSLELITLGLNDPHPLVRGTAIEQINSLPPETSIKMLKKLLLSSALIERGSAIDALKDRTENEIPSLVWETYMRSLDPQWVEVRENILDLIMKTKDSKLEPKLMIAANDPDEGVRAKARRLLVSMGALSIPKDMVQPPRRSPFRDIKYSKNPHVIFHMQKGDIEVECFAKEAPVHVADLIGLVKKGFYNKTIWHRVVPNFVVQGGDPDGTGWGGSNYSLKSEMNTKPYIKGTLGMPRSQGFDTGQSQLFFTLMPTPHLEMQYTVYGQVIRGLEVLDQIERGDEIRTAEVIL